MNYRLSDQVDSRATITARHGQTADFVYEAIKAELINGRWGEGDRLVETALAADYSVSRTPVREALQRLIVEGFLERNSGRGLTVKPLTPEEVEDLYMSRLTLEGLAARLAAQRVSPYELVTLQELHSRQIAALDEKRDPEVLAALNREFHTEILRIGRSANVARFMAQIHESLRRYGPTTLGLPDRAKVAVEEHKRLLDAIAARNEDLAEHHARVHIEAALHARLRILAQRRLDTIRLKE